MAEGQVTSANYFESRCTSLPRPCPLLSNRLSYTPLDTRHLNLHARPSLALSPHLYLMSYIPLHTGKSSYTSLSRPCPLSSHLPVSYQALTLCRAQSAGGSSHYPWAVVANNLTLMLADVLEMRANQFASSRKGYWGVFDRRGAFFEVNILFLCLKIASEWAHHVFFLDRDKDPFRVSLASFALVGDNVAH